MPQRWKITILVLAAAGIFSTPLIWLLDSPDAGQLTGASVQAAVGIAAFIWALFQHPETREDDAAVRTGQAHASSGGTAVAGIKRPQGQGSGSARAERTGNATAESDGKAITGIDYS
ncbi:hypothetical protein [Streptomyces cylindrosporus]|uniref:Secreted protein n=1 Tax=Streptomyces cylindrosporus TaxID=2927583 RepID=A0ABS9YIA9_9ACTN|nr:hypothetical protein [Streptomyces cylindrosporus]MCI3276988.1 hypothetical protein [Streptomyces cylindrosporus]